MLFKKKLGGIIGFLNLEDFWYSLTTDEQKDLIHEGYDSPIEGTFYNDNANKLSYIGLEIPWADAAHNYILADKLIDYGNKVFETGKMIDKHFFLQSAAENYYKQRDIREDALSLSEKYCLLDIDLYEKYKDAMSMEWKTMTRDEGFNGRVSSYSRLGIIYEKSNRFEEAIELYESALQQGQNDKTKGGFEGKIAKLRKKINLDD